MPSTDRSSGRFRLLLPLGLAALACFALLRTALLLTAWSDVELGPGTLLRLYGTGALYDLAFLAYAAVPLVLYLMLAPQRLFRSRWHRPLAYGLCYALLYGLLFVLAAEWVFWGEFGARFNFIAVDYLVYSDEVLGNIRESYPVGWLLGGLGLLALALLWALRRPIRRTLDADSPLKARLLVGGGLLLLPAVAFLALDQRPGQAFDNQYLNELSENGPYQFFHAFRDAELSYAQFYIQHDDAAVAAQLRRQVQQPNQTFLTPAGYDLARHVDNTDRGPERNLNVMLIVVESLSAKYLGAYGTTDADTTGLTPNLDRLAAQSLWLSNLYATGTRTVRGLESLTLSVPPTPGESIVKRPDNGGLFSLGQLFAAHGYDSTFLYGGFGYFDNMNDFFGKNGFRIVDRAAMTSPEIAFANIWGVADESLYDRAMREADGDFARGQPFFQLVMTTSNHRPYSYPDGRIDIPSKTGRAGAVKYTDWAIGDLLEKARQKPWFNDTLFVIVADHCAGSDGRTALPLDRYRIPLFVYSPAHVQPQRIERLVGQIDVAPTLLGLLHWNYDSRFFGKDILRMTDADERALLSNYQHLGLLDHQRLVVLSPGNKASVLEPADARTARPLAADSRLLDPALALYQGAARIYRQHLGLWPGAPGNPAPRLAVHP
ncbi:MAG: LTA synthase family protein [Immundisolibacter sp.]|uniref:LTA synthase family protein n=1 Tax=Immundisolibacter sp. TaxID=1934948 RepID=UPI0019CB3DEE|nr:LTA synthase family protein [Immundisolibacter sp.]MBC7163203.1 LTA synthase family protein [Immundisolibacter sp.]